MGTPSFEDLLTTMKRTCAVLRDADVRFALGGGLATWARGGPGTEHDVDLVIRRDDVERALDALQAAGLRTERPPEDWLVKAYDGEGADQVMVDLIFHPSGIEVDDDFLDRCEELMVHAMRLPAMRVEDVLVSKLLSLTEHHLDFSRLLETSRSLREQIHWREVRERTGASPFARAFFALVEELGVLPADEGCPGASASVTVAAAAVEGTPPAG